MRHATAALLATFFSLSPAFAQPAISAPVKVLAPVVESSGKALEVRSSGGKVYPVFRPADDSPLVRRVNQVLRTSFAHQVILLDRYARNLVLSESLGTAPEALTAPVYLLLSHEEGGFQRHGFWLQDAGGSRRLVLAGYIDLVVDEQSVEDGGLEEIFSHELGHQILGELVGRLPAGPSRKMHQSMTITDYSTAFDEGYAEHFQPLARDATTNAHLHELTSGTTGTDLDRLWISRLDTQLRSDGVKRNVFIHRKALPPSVLDPESDRYRLYLDDETSTAFLNDELRTGQQMMASEGVIATIFYRIVNDRTLREHYRDAAFYRPFSKSGRQGVSPYQNINLKLFVAMRHAAVPIAAGTPPMIALINAYTAAFPDEAQTIDAIFLQTTRGATASNELAAAFERAAAAGRIGDIGVFRPVSYAAFLLLQQTIERVTRGELPLDASLGPQLWLLNGGFKIAPAIWSSDRRLPFTLNLNTATEVELMTIPDIDLALARKIIAARARRGFFRSVDDLINVVPPELMQQFRSMSEHMTSAPAIPRP